MITTKNFYFIAEKQKLENERRRFYDENQRFEHEKKRDKSIQ